MLTHKGFSAWVSCEGNPLPEYLVTVEEEERRISCWIPGEEGKQFSVAWLDHGSKVDTAGYIALDGFTVAGRFLFGEGQAERSGVRSGPNSERAFVFMGVPEDAPQDIASSCSSTPAVKDVGTISLRIKQVRLAGSHPANPFQLAGSSPPQTVLGKRKAAQLYIGYGEEREALAQSPTTWAVKPVGENVPEGAKPSTFLTFVFRYRPREFLISQGIMPDPDACSMRHPSKRPSQTKRSSTRRIVSAPSVPTIATGSVLGLDAASGHDIDHTLGSAPSATVPSLIHVAQSSASTATHSADPSSSLVTPSPSPKESPPKRRKIDRADFVTNGPYRLRRPSDMRRAVSWRAPNTTSQFEIKPHLSLCPGEGAIDFTNPFNGKQLVSEPASPLTGPPPSIYDGTPAPGSSESLTNCHFTQEVVTPDVPSRPLSTQGDFSWTEFDHSQTSDDSSVPSLIEGIFRHPTSQLIPNESEAANPVCAIDIPGQELEWLTSDESALPETDGIGGQA